MINKKHLKRVKINNSISSTIVYGHNSQAMFMYTVTMDKFDDFVSVYKLNENAIKEINLRPNNSEKTLICLDNLQGLSSQMIDDLDENIKYIKVQTEETQEKLEKYCKNSKFISPSKMRDFHLEKTDDYINSACIYDRQELKSILQKMEELEKGIESLDDEEKAIIIYDRLRRNIKYDYATNSTPSFETRSLRGLLFGKSVCAGYSAMLCQMLKRQNIECHYKISNNHAWNEIVLDGKNYLVDLTWDSQGYHLEELPTKMKYFCQMSSEKNHIDLFEGEKNYNTMDYLKIFRTLSKVREMVGYNITSENVTTKIRSMSDRYLFAEIGTESIRNKNDKYVNMAKYFYQPFEPENGLGECQILYSNVSLNKIQLLMDGLENDGKLNSSEYSRLLETRKMFFSQLLSKENIKRASNMQTRYLGNLIYDHDKVEFDDGVDKCKSDLFDTKTFRSTNAWSIEYMPFDNPNINRYNFVKLTQDGGLEKYSIYSEQNLLALDNEKLEKLILSPQFENSLLQRNGYVGSIAQNGKIEYDLTSQKIIDDFTLNRFGIDPRER